jgi:hypothetical protein
LLTGTTFSPARAPIELYARKSAGTSLRGADIVLLLFALVWVW